MRGKPVAMWALHAAQRAWTFAEHEQERINVAWIKERPVVIEVDVIAGRDVRYAWSFRIHAEVRVYVLRVKE